jgi:hypothetical protein
VGLVSEFEPPMAVYWDFFLNVIVIIPLPDDLITHEFAAHFTIGGSFAGCIDRGQSITLSIGLLA